MGIAAILVTEAWPLKQIFNSPLTEGATWNLVELPLVVISEENTHFMMLYMYAAKEQG